MEAKLGDDHYDCLVAHIQTFVCFVKSKTKIFVYKFCNNILFGVFETVKLMDFFVLLKRVVHRW